MSSEEMLARLYREKLDAEAKLKAQEALLTDYQKKIHMLEQKVAALSAMLPDKEEDDDPTRDIDVATLIIEADRRGVKHYEGGLGLEELTDD